MSETAAERQIRVRALKHAVPYLKRFGGKTFVIKTGGAAVAAEEAVKGLVEQVALLFKLGIRVVLVHGGGPQSTELARKLGVRSRFVDGRRVTDSEALRVTTMVLNGEINTRILAACRDFELPAIGLSEVDAGLIRAHRRPPVKVGEGAAEETVDYGYVGDIDRVDSALLERLLGIGALPVVSPISADEAGTLLNINADTVASALSVALGAEKLIVLGEAPGLLADPNDPGSVISFLDLAGLERMRESGAIRTGMLPKAACIRKALQGGVARAHLLPAGTPDSLLLEVFTPEGCGTLVVPDLSGLSEAERTLAKRGIGGNGGQSPRWGPSGRYRGPQRCGWFIAARIHGTQGTPVLTPAPPRGAEKGAGATVGSPGPRPRSPWNAQYGRLPTAQFRRARRKPDLDARHIGRAEFQPPSFRSHRREPARAVVADKPALRDFDPKDIEDPALGRADCEGSVPPRQTPLIEGSHKDLCDRPPIWTQHSSADCPLSATERIRVARKPDLDARHIGVADRHSRRVLAQPDELALAVVSQPPAVRRFAAVDRNDGRVR